ncbi:Phage tail length tape-measure protein [Actinosynnema pretiosum subsp. pretiosum]|nr:Phage tail length tape-measure protein [Actinosynnema pretiosum subsp. pretiosum]
MAGGALDILIRPDFGTWQRELDTGLNQSANRVSGGMKTLGLAVVGGTALAAKGFTEVIQLGNEYTGALNEIGAVSEATGFEMARVSEVANELGSDLTLPATSAADAAAAMRELAKGGLDIDQAMTAARGTLQLAAAAQVEAAEAAGVQSDALNQFGLAADQASHVADVLANVANAASGEIMDVANALQYVGPVAQSVGVSIDEVATAIGVVATQGIRGEQAGTSLRGMLASLAAPSGPATKALDALGITAFDTTGRFVGLRSITEQLSAAQQRMTQETFAAATATAFGNEGMTVAASLAASGATAFDDMAEAVGRQGGAADVAAAKTAGLGGAMDGLQSQLESSAIGIYDAIDEPLERAVRAVATRLDQLGPAVASRLETAVAAGGLYGPRLAAAIEARADVVGDAVSDVLGPLGTGAIEPLNTSVNTGIELWNDFTGALDNTVQATSPVAREIGELAAASGEGTGVVGTLSTVVGVLGGAVEALSGVLVPVGTALSGVLGLFNDLPGPVQTGALALVAFRLAQGRLSDSTVLSGLRQFGGEMRTQQALAQSSGQEVGRLGAAMAAYRTSTVPAVATARDFTDQTAAIRAGAAATGEPIGRMSAAMGTLAERSPALASIRGSFEQAASGATRFGAAAGVAAASGTALRLGTGALVSALGGPVGLAIGGVALGLSLLSGRQEAAAERARQHSSAVDALAAALSESSGRITESVRAHQAQQLQSEKVAESGRTVADAARAAGISLSDLTEATLGNGDALDGVRGRLNAIIQEQTRWVTNSTGWKSGVVSETKSLTEQGKAAQDLLGEIDGLARQYQEADRKQRDLDQALREGRASMVDGTDSGRRFADAMGTLADETGSADDKARALKTALDALSGGSVDLVAAQSRMHELLSRLSEKFGESVDRTKGWGAELLTAQGRLDTTRENARGLHATLTDLRDAAADTALKTYELARAQGEDVTTALAKAGAEVALARDGFYAAAEAMGIGRAEAEALANQYGLLPSQVVTLIDAQDVDKTTLELQLLKWQAEQVPDRRSITVETLSDQAVERLRAVGLEVNNVPGGKEIVLRGNDSDFNAKIASATAPATKYITVIYTSGKSMPNGPMAVNHDGNLLAPSIVAYAAGGIHPLTPMRSGWAQFVDPNTWRVIGDRMTHREAYIPVDGSTRSTGILAETARLMGFELIRKFAVGGLATPAVPASLPTATTAGAAPVITNNVTVQSNQDAHVMAAVLSSTAAWQARTRR